MVVIALPNAHPFLFADPFSHVVQILMLFSRGESIILDRATPGRTSLSILFCPNNGFGLALLCSLRRSMVRKLQVSTSSSYRRKVSPNTIHAKVAPILAKYSIIYKQYCNWCNQFINRVHVIHVKSIHAIHKQYSNRNSICKLCSGKQHPQIVR